jgi:cation/acetate symporter
MLHTNPMLGGSLDAVWFHIAPISAGVFGVPAGLAAAVIGSLLTAAPHRASSGLVDYVRAPEPEPGQVSQTGTVASAGKT